MARIEDRTPTRRDAQRIARSFAGEAIASLDRYETGLCHWVYRCETASGRVFVLRVARPAHSAYIAGGMSIGRALEGRRLQPGERLDRSGSGAGAALRGTALARMME